MKGWPALLRKIGDAPTRRLRRDVCPRRQRFLSLRWQVVTDTRRHRGAHPEDGRLFGRDNWPVLQHGVRDYSWLISRGYPENASLKLVGDRLQLPRRGRMAVLRSSCTDAALADRTARRLGPQNARGQVIAVDGFNVLLTIEAALAGGYVLAARDGCYRDMASVHGTYRAVEETPAAVELVAHFHRCWAVDRLVWLFDRPVSNSGRLAELVRQRGAAHQLDWSTELVANPDHLLAEGSWCVASADSQVLDHCAGWLNLAQQVITGAVPAARIVPMHAGDEGL